MSDASKNLRLGTRGSLLARAQSKLVADELMRLHPSLHVELVMLQTTGDRVQDRPLHNIGGKGLFVKEIEQALLEGRIDFAVHSYKDVPVTMPLVEQSNLIIAAVPKREDPRDAAVMHHPSSPPLRKGARIGTSSLRRRCQILEACPDAQVIPIRGNIDTRIRKVRDGEFDVAILAMAGLKRAGLFEASSMTPLNLVPAPAQGALALQCRRDDARTRTLLAAVNDSKTEQAVTIERAIVAALHGDCHSPIAAHATLSGSQVTLDVVVGSRGGELPIVRCSQTSNIAEIIDKSVKQLAANGAAKLLSELD